MAGILFVSGGDDLARSCYTSEGRGYWSQALPLVLEKHGYLAVEAAGPQALATPAALETADIVLVARLPEDAWDAAMVENLRRGTTPALLEGPLPSTLESALGVESCGRSQPEGELIVTDPALSTLAQRFWAHPGGTVSEPVSRPIDRRPELEWSALDGVPLSNEQARAWRARAWDVDKWQAKRETAVLAEWHPRDKGEPVFPAVVRRGLLTGCAFGIFAFLGQRHTSEPFGAREHRTAARSIGIEAVLLGLIDDMYRLSGLRRPRVLPWPAGCDWALNVRHDVLRPVSDDRISELLEAHSRTGTQATWHFLPRLVSGGQAARVASSAGHEVALHAEWAWTDAASEEQRAVEAAARRPVRGSSAHGSRAGFRHQGAPNVLWAEHCGLAHTELLQHGHLHPHRFPALGADGTIRALRVICLPHQESVASSSAAGIDPRLEDMARRWRTAGGLLQVTGRAVAHRRELFELLNALPRGGRLDCTAAEAADWWSKTHVLGEVQIRQSEPDRLEVLGRSAVQGLMLELLHPTGRAEYHLLDLEPGQVATVEPSASPLDEYEASPGSSWNWAAAEWRHALRRYHEDRGRSPDSSEAARVIRHNTEAVPRRGDQLMRLLAAMTGAELTDKRVMDVGCGFGALAAYIAIRGRVRSLVGTDINADHLRLAADCAERTGLHQRVRFRRGDMLDLSTLGEEPFDLAVANGVLIYLVTGRDLDRALGELHRILKPNGLLLARHANKWRREDPFTRRPLVHLVPWPLLWLKRRMTGSHDGDRRVRLVSVVELRRRLRRAGFGDVRFIGISEERRDTGIKRYFADAYAVTARRLP